jgi:hypothetical protein
MAILIAEHGYKASSFQPAEGGESIYAPVRMERRFVRGHFLEPGPLKGTMLLWQRSDYYSQDWDAAFPNEVLDDIIFWSNWEPTAEDLADPNHRGATE